MQKKTGECPMYQRLLDLPGLLKRKSFFLFGPRMTGKTTLIRQTLGDVHFFDLLRRDHFRRLVKNPGLLAELDPGKTTVIDEIQKLPGLLDEVHRLIEGRGMRFLMTGSSARKLRRGAANLLAGRAWQANLFPLTWRELPDFDLLKYLNRGGMPHVYQSEDAGEELAEYVSLYLREEIQAEAATRNIEAFSEFLDMAGRSNGQEINYQSFASDCGVAVNTIKNYFQVLEDTLVGFRLPAFTGTTKRKAITRAKHYFFDIGVVGILSNRGTIKDRSNALGPAFEHFIIQELRAYLAYTRNRKPLHYWRSTSRFEVDVIIGNAFALEIKAAESISDKHLKGLRAFKEEGVVESFMVVSRDPIQRVTTDGIHIVPYSLFLEKLWAGQLIT
jgi:predicted AAA+ superfamily ATPase